MRGCTLGKLMKIGFVLSLLGFLFYFLSPSLLDRYVETGTRGGLILFGFGWAVLLGSFVFHLGMEAHKDRGGN